MMMVSVALRIFFFTGRAREKALHAVVLTASTPVSAVASTGRKTFNSSPVADRLSDSRRMGRRRDRPSDARRSAKCESVLHQWTMNRVPTKRYVGTMKNYASFRVGPRRFTSVTNGQDGRCRSREYAAASDGTRGDQARRLRPRWPTAAVKDVIGQQSQRAARRLGTRLPQVIAGPRCRKAAGRPDTPR